MLSVPLTLHESGFMHVSGQIQDMELMLQGTLLIYNREGTRWQCPSR